MTPPSLPRLLLLVLHATCLSYLAILSLFALVAVVLLLHPLVAKVVYCYSFWRRVGPAKDGQKIQRLSSKLPLSAEVGPANFLLRGKEVVSERIEASGEPGRPKSVQIQGKPRQYPSDTPTHGLDIEVNPPDVVVPGHLARIDLSGQRDVPIPTQIPCRLVINLDGTDAAARSYRHHKYFLIEWQDTAYFERCVEKAEAFLKSELEPKYSFFMSSSHYRIVKQSTLDQSDSWLARRRTQERQLGDHSDEVELYSESVKNRGTWQWSLPRRLSQQMIADADAIIFLELAFSYTRYTPYPVSACNGVDCTSIIRNTLSKERIKLRQSPLNHVQKPWLVSAKLIHNFFTKDLVQHLVNHDTRLKQDSNWSQLKQPKKEEFVKQVHANCLRLLACSIMAKLDLRFIFHLVESGKADVDMPLTGAHLPPLSCLGSDDLDSEDMSLAYEAFLRYQGSFKAHSFQNDEESEDGFLADHEYQTPRKHVEIDPLTVIPILDPEPLAIGANAAVYRVRLHNDHHDFSADRNKNFAVKHVVRDRTLKDITHESKILGQLAEVPHPHITTLLASWSQLHSCSILLPLAKETLASMMTTSPEPKLQGCFVRWLLAQMSGLAAALDHIHNLGPAKLGSERPPENGDRSKAGVHHDLHPGNILVFENDVLKISDFGTARLQQVLGSGKGSYKSHKLRCHSGYEAPENVINHAAGRPHDVWALGCIFLEMLVWASGHSVKKFTEDRQNAPDTPQYVQDDAFWYTEHGRIHLKQAVLMRMMILEFQHKDRHLFQRLLQMVKHMLRVETQSTKPSPRLNISQVLNVLKNMTAQAELDLSYYGEAYFMETIPERSGGKFFPPSDVMSRADIGDTDDYRPKHLVYSYLPVPRASSGSRRKSTGGTYMKSDQLPRLSTAKSAHILTVSNHPSDLAQAGAHHGDVFHVATPGTPSIKLTDHDKEQGTPISQAVTEACFNGQCAYNPSMPCSHTKVDAQKRLDELVGLFGV